MSIFEGLRFRPGKSFVHRIDPRFKLLISTVAVGRVIHLWLKTLRGSSTLAALVFIITLAARILAGGSVYDALGYAITYTYRLIVFLTSFSLFFLTTTPEEIALTMSKMRIPYEYVFAFVSAVRFTPVIADEMRAIMDAQRSRGLELDRGRFTTRIRRLIPILIPLLVNVLRRSYELAEAMEVKCFGASKKRTYLRDLNPKTSDYLVLAGSISLFTIVIYMRVSGYMPFEALTGIRLASGM
jgi:energy-coupling factor transport system permease protein